MSVVLQRMRARAGIAWLLLAPLLLLRVLVPAGFMPTVAADQSITMQMCSGHGAVPASVPLRDGGPAGSGERASRWRPR